MKGEGKYQIKFPSVDWAEEDVEIDIHCDAGRILTKTGRRPQLGIRGFVTNKINEKSKTRTSTPV